MFLRYETKKIPQRITIYMCKLRQSQFMTAYKFVQHHLINDEEKRAVSCIYSSIYRRFGPFEVGLYSVNGAYNYCASGIFLVPRVREWPMGLKIDYHIGRAQILTALLAYRPHSDPPYRLQAVPARPVYTMAGRAYRSEHMH